MDEMLAAAYSPFTAEGCSILFAPAAVRNPASSPCGALQRDSAHLHPIGILTSGAFNRGAVRGAALLKGCSAGAVPGVQRIL